MQNAVLTATPIGNFCGVSATVQYTIQAGAAITDVPTDILLGGEEMILRDKIAIASGVDTVAVVYSEAFPPGTNVIVTASVAKPGGAGSNIFATIRDDLSDVNGFTAELSGKTPDANHKLNWFAIGT